MNIIPLIILLGLFPLPAIATTTPSIGPNLVITATLPSILENIALCESNNVANAKNPNSSASGRFQFLDSSWKYYGKKLWGENFEKKNKLNFEDSTDLAVYVYGIDGVKPWLSSQECWKSLGDV